MKRIDIREVEYIAHSLAKEMMTWDEPIPGFNTRYPNILESCLAMPFQTFARKSMYQGLVRKGAILFYLIIKNHPFENGNKRIAVTTLLVFLIKNEKWLKVDNQALYNFAIWIAESNPKFKTEVVHIIEKFIREHLTPI